MNLIVNDGPRKEGFWEKLTEMLISTRLETLRDGREGASGHAFATMVNAWSDGYARPCLYSSATATCAADSRAIGIRKGEQLT